MNADTKWTEQAVSQENRSVEADLTKEDREETRITPAKQTGPSHKQE